MHKPFYASGFLYHSSSQQILLQQLGHDINTTLVLFGGKSRNGYDPQSVFQKSVEKSLNVKLASSSIHAVYDYEPDGKSEQFIFYVEVSDVTLGAGWFSLSKLSKQAMSEQTRHDIVVGERVIRSLSEPPREPSPLNTH